MSCDKYREALSARLDGESLGMTEAALAQHLACCPGCASWLTEISRITRLARVAPAERVPDLTRTILAATVSARGRPRSLIWRPASPRGAAVAGRPLSVTFIRVALVVLALTQASLAWPALVLGEVGMPAAMHVAHEAGAWNLALAVAFLGAGLRPERAGALVPFLGAFVAVLAAVVIPDLVTGSVGPGRVATHLVVVVGLVLVIALARADRLGPRAPAGDSAGGDESSGGMPADDRSSGHRAVGDGAAGNRVANRAAGGGAVGGRAPGSAA